MGVSQWPYVSKGFFAHSGDLNRAIRHLDDERMLMSLQLVMNPHFFYNTLSAIGAKADEGCFDAVNDCCCDLALIMRYLSNCHGALATVAEEMKRVAAYLRIMRMRLSTEFAYTIRVQEEAKAKPMAKTAALTLCEFVANELGGGAAPFKMDVRVGTEGGGCRISVATNYSERLPESMGALYDQMWGLGVSLRVDQMTPGGHWSFAFYVLKSTPEPA